jgi:K+-sensing histidine kinase KdpD
VRRKNQKPAALVCVTNQLSCDRLIHAGKALADRQELDLKVFCAQPREFANNSSVSEIEYLFATSRKVGAEMTVYYRDDPARAAVLYIRANRIAHIVLGGVPDILQSDFITTICAECLDIPISIVDEAGNLKLLSAGREKTGQAIG